MTFVSGFHFSAITGLEDTADSFLVCPSRGLQTRSILISAVLHKLPSILAGSPNVTPRSVPIPKSHWLADSLTSASGRRTPDGPPPVTTAPCLRSLTVGVGIKQGEILGRTEQYKHAHSIYTVHDVIQEVISYIMFHVRYNSTINTHMHAGTIWDVNSIDHIAMSIINYLIIRSLYILYIQSAPNCTTVVTLSNCLNMLHVRIRKFSANKEWSNTAIIKQL